MTGGRHFRFRIEPFQRLAAPFPIHSQSAGAFRGLRPRWTAVLAPVQPFQTVRRQNLSQITKRLPHLSQRSGLEATASVCRFSG